MSGFLAGVAREFMSLLPAVPAILWAISFHECCHGWAADRCGDPTARLSGRMTLNPMAHIDPWGVLCLFLFHFGWAKPVPIDPRNFRRPRRDLIIVSLAGIVGNIVTAVAVGLVIRGLFYFSPRLILSNYGLQQVLIAFILINLNFAVFNLLPIPPLDGSRLLYVFLPPKMMRFAFWLERYSLLILLLLIYTGVVGRILAPVARWGLRIILG